MNPCIRALDEYHIPIHMDVLEIDILWTDIPDPHTPMGARCIGEIGITGTAIGKRIRHLSITLDKIM